MSDELEYYRTKIKLSLLVCENVLDNFSNLQFAENILESCENKCYDSFKDYKGNDYSTAKNELIDCSSQCDNIYKNIIDHQAKGAEISYYTYQKHLKRCKDLSNNDPEKLLSCYSYKVEKIIKRFGSYYFNQRMNLINRYKNL